MLTVLDSSAVLAFLLAEPGADLVAEALPTGILSTVNLAEVVAVLARGGNPPADVQAIVADLSLPTLPPDEAMAIDAGLLYDATRAAGLSLGDRFCLALARKLGVPVVTADRAWLKVGVRTEVDVRLIR